MSQPTDSVQISPEALEAADRIIQLSRRDFLLQTEIALIIDTAVQKYLVRILQEVKTNLALMPTKEK